MMPIMPRTALKAGTIIEWDGIGIYFIQWISCNVSIGCPQIHYVTLGCNPGTKAGVKDSSVTQRILPKGGDGGRANLLDGCLDFVPEAPLGCCLANVQVAK